MTFIWPVMLFSLVFVPLLVGLYLMQQQRRRQLAARFGSLGWVPGGTNNRLGLRRHIAPLFFLVGLTILLVSLARPQMPVSLPRIEGTVLLAFDVSGSMAADDMEPNRMEAAKAAARAFVERQSPSLLIGVVAFSGSGMAIQAPTNDQQAIFASIDRLRPQQGTSLGQGILTALNTIALINAGPIDRDRPPEPTPTPTPVPEGVYMPAAIVMITDGENNVSPDPLAAAQAAADRGVRIYTIGIGSPEGTVLNLDGFSVHTRLDEEMLQAIAQITGGAYYNAATQEDLQSIYENLSPQLVVKTEEMEVTSIFAGAGILALLLGGMFSLWWFSRLP